MKPLAQLINTEKAKLLHQLFPEEIPELLIYIKGVSEAIREDETSHRSKWENGLLTFDFWLSLLNDADLIIKKYGKRLHTDSRLFSDQLFDGYLALYMTHCLVLYTTTREHPNKKFSLAIDLLFNP